MGNLIIAIFVGFVLDGFVAAVITITHYPIEADALLAILAIGENAGTIYAALRHT
jgi:hypothetical protein